MSTRTYGRPMLTSVHADSSTVGIVTVVVCRSTFFSACGLMLCLLACWHLSNLGGKTL